MKISNNKNVPLTNRNNQNTNNFAQPLSSRVPKNQSESITKNIQHLHSQSKDVYNKSPLTNQNTHSISNNHKPIFNHQVPNKVQLIQNNTYFNNHQSIPQKKRNQLITNKNNQTNFQNQYHSNPYIAQTNNVYTGNNVIQNQNYFQIQHPQKNIYVSKFNGIDPYSKNPINQKIINNTNNFNHIYPQLKVIQPHSISNQKVSKQYLNTLNLSDQELLQKSKSSHNINIQNIYTLQNSQSNQSQFSQNNQNSSKSKQGKLNLKKKKHNEGQNLNIFSQSNPSKQYYAEQTSINLTPFGSQKNNKKHNFLRLSKSLDQNQHHREKLHLHTSRFGNKINFDRMYDQEDFGSKNDGGSQQSNGLDYESLGGSENQRKKLTSMESELKRRKAKQNVMSNPNIQLKQNQNQVNNKSQQKAQGSLQVQPFFKVKSNQNINVNKQIVYLNEYMIQGQNQPQRPQILFNLNKKVISQVPQQFQSNKVAFNSQNAQKKDLKQVVKFQGRYQTNQTQQLKVFQNPQNIAANQINFPIIFQQKSQQKVQQNQRPNSSIPQFGFVNNVQNLNNGQRQNTSKFVLNLNSNIRKQKTLISQPSTNQRPQSQTVQTQNYQNINAVLQKEQSAMRVHPSPSFGRNNGSNNSFLNINSHLKSKQSLQKHLIEDHLLPQKKQTTNSLSSILNNEFGLNEVQVRNAQTVDNASKLNNIRQNTTKKTLLQKAQSHGLSDLIMGLKPINVITNNSIKTQQKIDTSSISKNIQRSSSHGLSDLIMGVKPIDFNKNTQNMINRLNSNQSVDSQKGSNKLGQMNDCLPIDSKPSSPQLAFGAHVGGVGGSAFKNKISPQNSLPDQYLNINSNITTLEKLTYNNNQLQNVQNQQKSKIQKKPSFSSQGSFSNLKINSNSKIINNFNYNNQQNKGSNLKSISEMQSQWEKQSSFQDKSQTNFPQYQQPNSQNIVQNFQKNIDSMRFNNFQTIQANNPIKVLKMNSMNENMNSMSKAGSSVFQQTGLFNSPSGLLKQSMEKKVSQNQQILPQQQSALSDQFLKLNTRIIQSKGIPEVEQVLKNGKPIQKLAPPQQWLNINRQKYSTSEYLNTQQMKKRMQSVENKQKNIYQQNSQQNKKFTEQNIKTKTKQLSKLKVIQKQNDDFRQKINSISETLLSMTPISISQEGSSPNKFSPNNVSTKPFIIQDPLQRQKVKQFDQKQSQQHLGQQKFQKTAQYFTNNDNNNNQFDEHIEYEYSEDGSYGNFGKQNKKSSFLLDSNSEYSQNQDLSDTKKITYNHRQTAKKKSQSKMKTKKLSKLSSSISQSSLHSNESVNKKQANLYTRKQDKLISDNRNKDKQKSNLNIESSIKNGQNKSNIMYSNSVFATQQQNYHKLPKPSLYQLPENQNQANANKNIQKLKKNGNSSEYKITYNPVQSEQMLQLSSINSLSFNFVATNNQPSRNSLKQNSMMGTSKHMDSSKLLDKETDKMQGSKSNVQKYPLISNQNNLYKPIPSNKSIKTYSVINDNNGRQNYSIQPLQYGQQIDRNEYSPQKNKLQSSQYGISQDSINYVKIDRRNSPLSISQSSNYFHKKQSIKNSPKNQNYHNNLDHNQQDISAILNNEDFLPQGNYYESRYEIIPSSHQVKYYQNPHGNDDSLYGKDSNVIQTMKFNHVSYE